MVDQRRGKSAGGDYAQPTNAPASDTREQVGGEYLCPVQRLIKKEPHEERSLFNAIKRAFANSPRVSAFVAAEPFLVPLLGEAEAIHASQVVEQVNTSNLCEGTDEDSLFSKAHNFESQVQYLYISTFSSFIGWHSENQSFELNGLSEL